MREFFGEGAFILVNESEKSFQNYLLRRLLMIGHLDDWNSPNSFLPSVGCIVFGLVPITEMRMPLVCRRIC